MLAHRIIPCLDIDRGRVVKGVSFVDLRDAGDPAELARFYNDAGADELVFLDITASSDQRATMIDVVRQVSSEVFIPLPVGGGPRSLVDIRLRSQGGAARVPPAPAADRRGDGTGATEAGRADQGCGAIVDIASSGGTLRANHLKLLSDGLILQSQATLCVSRAAAWGDGERAALARLAERLGVALEL